MSISVSLYNANQSINRQCKLLGKVRHYAENKCICGVNNCCFTHIRGRFGMVFTSFRGHEHKHLRVSVFAHKGECQTWRKNIYLTIKRENICYRKLSVCQTCWGRIPQTEVGQNKFCLKRWKNLKNKRTKLWTSMNLIEKKKQKLVFLSSQIRA